MNAAHRCVRLRLLPMAAVSFATAAFAIAIAGPAAEAASDGVAIPGFSVHQTILGYEPVLSTWKADLPDHTLFTTRDRQAVFSVDLGEAGIDTEQTLTALWLDPSGKGHARQTVRPIASGVVNAILPIRNSYAEHKPGAWKVQLRAGDEVLTEREFELRSAP